MHRAFPTGNSKAPAAERLVIKSSDRLVLVRNRKLPWLPSPTKPSGLGLPSPAARKRGFGPNPLQPSPALRERVPSAARRVRACCTSKVERSQHQEGGMAKVLVI